MSNRHLPPARFRSTAIVATLALLAVMAPTMFIPAGAAADPDSVSLTLDGCRNDGSPPITLPNDDDAFVCPDDAYTSGNLGKGWNELDLVPYRLTADAGNSAPAVQTYTVAVVVDNEDVGKPGYDVLSQPVLNDDLSDDSCSPATIGPETLLSPGLGGIDSSRYRKVTITQDANTTCVYDYYARLALGSHLFPGSSLHANLANQNLGTAGIGARDVSIPVKEIKPQELDKDMSATLDSDHSWNLIKSATPATHTFSDTCTTASSGASTSVSVTLTWTKGPGNPGGFTVTTNIYATNPASRIIAVDVTDRIYSGTDLLDTHEFETTEVPPNKANFLVGTHTINVAADDVDDIAEPNFNDVAEAAYTDDDTGVPVPGTTQAAAAVANEAIGVGTVTNATATISDSESITGAGFTFSVDEPPMGSFSGYIAGTPTTGPVVWNSGEVSDSGSVTFDKTVYLDKPRVTSGSLSDSASLTGSNGAEASASASTSLSATASVSITIDKTIPASSAAHTFNFKVKRASDDSVAGTASISFAAGETNKSATVSDLAPGVYYVSEDPVAGWNPQADSGLIDLGVKAGGSLSCRGSARFTNEPLGRIIVKKLTDPTGDPASFSFTLKGGPSALDASFSLRHGEQYDSGYVRAGSGYAAAEASPSGWDLSSAVCDDGSPTGNIDLSPGETVTCTFTNTDHGDVTVIKTVSGAAPPAGTAFRFQVRRGASTTEDGAVLLADESDAAGTVDFGGATLSPGPYQLCEVGLGAGWRSSLSNEASTFVPNSDDPNHSTDLVCVDFTLEAGEHQRFEVDNTPPPPPPVEVLGLVELPRTGAGLLLLFGFGLSAALTGGLIRAAGSGRRRRLRTT